MNDAVQDLVNGMAGHIGLLDDLMKLIARDFIYLAIPLLLGMWFWPRVSAEQALNQRVAAVAAVAAAVALAAGSIAGSLHTEARPFVSDPGTRLLIQHSADNGFPSDHALVTFALGGTVVWWRRLVGVLVCLVALLIGFARVFVGVHWPSDILGGALIGLAVGIGAAQTVPWWTWLQGWAAQRLPVWLVARP